MAEQRTRSLSEQPLGEYLEAVGSATPAPGGGSVIGVVAALAASLGGMVSRLTLAKQGEATDPELTSALGWLDDAENVFLELATADQAAYSGYIEATRLPKATDAERSARTDAQQDALLVAADVPLAVAERCVELLDVLHTVAATGRRHALPDCAVGAWLAAAAARGALLNVRTNAVMIADPAIATAYRERADRFDTAIATNERRVHDTVASRAH